MSRLFSVFLFVLMAAAVRAQERTHVVRPGDTIAKLMWTYGVTGASILQANHLRSGDLRPGTTLVIPTPPAAPRAESVPVARAEPAPPPAPAIPPPTPVEESPRPALSEESAPQPRGGDFSAAIAIPAGANVRYNGRWVPPGESTAWVMDCSNTTRWLYREARGQDLPRTASDQYEWLRARKRLWRIGPNANALRRRLEPGDLLFWEDTYKPVRRPPVTHVMLYLGTDARGRMMMAGSQGASGPDTYEFQPAKKMGGYRFFFFFRRDGKFVAYGRP